MRELMLRTSDKDRKSHHGFQWPESGPVEAPDWDPRPRCGGGLHGAARGEGEGFFFNWSPDAVWQVVEYDPEEAIDLDDKIKIPRGVVVYSGGRLTATRLIQERYPDAAVIGGTAIAGFRGTAIAGVRGAATAGVRGAATAGDYGTATAGHGGAATAGDRGIATAGYGGTATAGDFGIATVGDYGIAIAEVGGTAAAGHLGIIQITYYSDRRRILVGYIGEDGLRPGVRYRVEDGRFVEAEE